MGHVPMKETMCLTKPARQRCGTLTIPEGGHADFNAHLGIAKDRHAETSPYGLMVRHSQPELTAHFGSRRQNRAVRLWHVVRIHVSNVLPAKTSSIQHKPHVVEGLINLCFDGSPSREFKRGGVPAALSR